MTVSTAALSMAQTPKNRPEVDPAPLLFCPFCRECFEGEKECPEHELALVPFERLPKEDDPDAVPAHDAPVPLFDARFGRGWVLAGIVILVAGFAMPLMEIATATQSTVFSGFSAAVRRAPNLWMLPFVAAMFAWVLVRRRTPIAMRGARLAGVVFAIAPLFALGYTLIKVTQGAAEHVARTGQAMDVNVEYGVVVVAVGALSLLIGSARLGVLPDQSRSVGARLRGD